MSQNDYDKAKIFFERQMIIHVSKLNGEFLNGLILEISEKFFVIKDFKKGDQFVFFNELKKPLELYINKKGDDYDKS